jgi:hypothetical protein
MSGAPQGSILDPILFLLYVNDLPYVVNNAKVASFADDTKLFKCVDSHIDGASIQSDLDNLEEWSTSSGLVFNQNKYKCQRITRKHMFMGGERKYTRYILIAAYPLHPQKQNPRSNNRGEGSWHLGY